MSDPPNVARSLYCGGLLDVMGLLQSGRVELGFIGGAEVDRFGNLNTHWVVEGKKIPDYRVAEGQRTLRLGRPLYHYNESWRNAGFLLGPLHDLTRIR